MWLVPTLSLPEANLYLPKGMLMRERGAGIGEREFVILDLFILNGRKKMKN